jgi:hypothetical protein
MSKRELLDTLLNENNGYLKTSDAVSAGVSRAYLGTYVQDRDLKRVIRGIYVSKDAWDDGMYVVQSRYPTAVFSHETALYLLNLAEREPLKYSLTLKACANASGLTKHGVKVYKVKVDLFDVGQIEALTPAGHKVRTYNPERTICDLFRSRRNIEIQDLQSAIKGYLRKTDKNIPLLLRYAKTFSVEKIVRQYLEVLL